MKHVHSVNMINVHTFCEYEAMSDMGERLKAARKFAKFTSARSAAIRHGWPISSYQAHENGQNGFDPDDAKRYGKAFRVNAGWLLTGDGAMTSKPMKAPAVGYIGAGAEVFPIDDHEIGGGLEEIDIPPGVPENAVLVIVRGDSMHPRYFDGEFLFYVRDGNSPREYIGRECVLKLADGKIFVKVLRRGSKPALFNLESWNGPTLEDQTIEWAAPVLARVNRRAR